MKQQNFFLIFCLILTLGLLQTYGVFRDYFSDANDLKHQVSNLKKENERERLRVALAQNQFRDLQTQVALVLPATTANFAEKNLIDQVRLPASENAIELSSVMLERGRKMFREKNYAQAIQTFSELVSTYPISPKAIEARFLKAECQFLSGQYPPFIDSVDEMITQFPENELTGFIMLRLGQILQARNRSEEAVEIYNIVNNRFPANVSLKTQSRNLLKSAQAP